MKVLQTFALPLGHGTGCVMRARDITSSRRPAAQSLADVPRRQRRASTPSARAGQTLPVGALRCHLATPQPDSARPRCDATEAPPSRHRPFDGSLTQTERRAAPGVGRQVRAARRSRRRSPAFSSQPGTVPDSESCTRYAWQVRPDPPADRSTSCCPTSASVPIAAAFRTHRHATTGVPSRHKRSRPRSRSCDSDVPAVSRRAARSTYEQSAVSVLHCPMALQRFAEIALA